jgi:hypothetical protein
MATGKVNTRQSQVIGALQILALPLRWACAFRQVQGKTIPCQATSRSMMALTNVLSKTDCKGI